MDFPGRVGQDQPRGRGAVEDILVPEETLTGQAHMTAIMRFIRQVGRVYCQGSKRIYDDPQ